jgi:hypothetical protein
MMTKYWLAGLVFLAAMAPALGQDQTGGDGRNEQPAAETAGSGAREQADKPVSGGAPVAMPVYVPPMRGAPAARVGGGTRGAGDELPYVSVVTPEHTGYTSSPQPVLYWYLSEPVDTRFEFALINDDQIEPVIEITTERDMRQGLNFLDMAEHGVSLKPGITYQWSVALVGQPEKRSSDIVSSGTIALVELDHTQRSALAQAGAAETVVIFAREGFWYDAFAGLQRLIEADPDNRGLVEQRSALLRQVGLDAVADAGF